MRDANDSHRLPVTTAAEHPAFAMLAWGIFSAVVNTAFRFKTAEEWTFFCDHQPRLAGVMRFVRAFGIDPVKGLKAIQAIAMGTPKPTQP